MVIQSYARVFLARTQLRFLKKKASLEKRILELEGEQKLRWEEEESAEVTGR